MTDTRETQAYQSLLQDGVDEVRETQAYVGLLGVGTSPDVRETQAYQFILGNTPTPDFRETQAYETLAQAGVDEVRDSLTYFTLLANEGATSNQCGLASFFPSGNAINALASPIDGGPASFASSMGRVGTIQ